MTAIYLERREPACNRQRFYTLTVSRPRQRRTVVSLTPISTASSVVDRVEACRYARCLGVVVALACRRMSLQSDNQIVQEPPRFQQTTASSINIISQDPAIRWSLASAPG